MVNDPSMGPNTIHRHLQHGNNTRIYCQFNPEGQGILCEFEINRETESLLDTYQLKMKIVGTFVM